VDILETVDMARVEVKDGEPEGGAKLLDAPLGRPEMVSVTGCVMPLKRDNDIV
jgi:hypothetical protein